MTSQLPWYVARAAGLVAWGLLTLSVVWGLALSTKVLGKRPRPVWLLDLHRGLGGLATVFTAVHVGAIVADSYVHFGLVSVLVPFASTWHPAAVAGGVVAMYLLAAVELTSLARSHLPRRLWRATHVASFPLFALATLHGFTAGTDMRTSLFVVLGVAGAGLVAALTAYRLARRAGGAAERPVTVARRPRPASPAGAASAVSCAQPVAPAPGPRAGRPVSPPRAGRPVSPPRAARPTSVRRAASPPSPPSPPSSDPAPAWSEGVGYGPPVVPTGSPRR